MKPNQLPSRVIEELGEDEDLAAGVFYDAPSGTTDPFIVIVNKHFRPLFMLVIWSDA